MPEASPDAPLDLSMIDDLQSSNADKPQSVAVAAETTAPTDPRLLPDPTPPRLVDIDGLRPEELTAAERSAARGEFPRYRLAAGSRGRRAG